MKSFERESSINDEKCLYLLELFKMILIICVICLILIVIIIVINRNELCEGYKTPRDFQLACMDIDDMEDFRDYCKVYIGSGLIEKMDISNEQKIKLVENYLRGINEMKTLARYNNIPINSVPKYGKMIKNNGKDDFTNFQLFF